MKLHICRLAMLISNTGTIAAQQMSTRQVWQWRKQIRRH